MIHLREKKKKRQKGKKKLDFVPLKECKAWAEA